MGIPVKGARMREVDVMGLFGALQKNGEAKLSDHYIDEREEIKSEEQSEEAQESQTRGCRR